MSPAADDRPPTQRARYVADMLLRLVSAILIMPMAARAQDAAPPPAQEEQRPTGLPKALEWTFNFDAGWGTFGFQNSLFTNPKEGVEENLSDQWFEGYIKPALSGSYTGSHGVLYGKLSAVGERTYGSAPDLVGADVSSFRPEDLYVGWRSGDTLDRGEDAVNFTIGRSQYRLGTGFLLYDGASEGGSRGGYWTNARKAFEFAAIGRFKTAHHKAEAFYLDRDELEENDSGSRLWGVNYEFSFGEESTVGATYMKWFADIEFRPERDGLNVFDVRAAVTPVPSVADLTVEFEYAREVQRRCPRLERLVRPGRLPVERCGVDADAVVSLRLLSGRRPRDSRERGVRSAVPRLLRLGHVVAGRDRGGYFLSNSNLVSHEVRVHATPIESIGTGLIFFNFNLDQPASFAPGVTATDVAHELDWYMDWKLNKNFTLSLVAAYADPGKAVQQAFDRTKNFTYGMIYVAYSY